MKKTDVPQDSDNSTYGGVRKLIYATNDKGEYEGVKSSGWSVEADATRSALQLINQQCDQAWLNVRTHKTSPLEYYMYYRRMDVALLAQTSGFFKWQIRRHLRPTIFAKLGTKVLTRYSEALEIDIDQLKQLPKQPLHVSS